MFSLAENAADNIVINTQRVSNTLFVMKSKLFYYAPYCRIIIRLVKFLYTIR
ncbi:hypothetical protein A1OE_469 [Candidatus Endolissoclinum faulkneri L2]|uniref:Uncharacterized protein n=1 Tax=Candidatus Endolissoclinum faulkneri L2 TaxID=1193729 RepID=K7YMC3_9PROT|nr:hypothetical protein A1OE_469 [Candidatus Endolissoclinum faulkneri L2]